MIASRWQYAQRASYKRLGTKSRQHSAVRARFIRDNAIRLGWYVIPDECEYCKKPLALQGHHEDYNKPLIVTWLCRRCHENRHTGMREEQNARARG